MAAKKKTSTKNPGTERFEITLEIETGNLIHRKFNNLKELVEFATEYTNNPEKIIEEITPKQNRKQTEEQAGFYDVDDEDDW